MTGECKLFNVGLLGFDYLSIWSYFKTLEPTNIFAARRLEPVWKPCVNNTLPRPLPFWWVVCVLAVCSKRQTRRHQIEGALTSRKFAIDNRNLNRKLICAHAIAKMRCSDVGVALVQATNKQASKQTKYKQRNAYSVPQWLTKIKKCPCSIIWKIDTACLCEWQ